MFDYIGGKKNIGKWISGQLPFVTWSKYTEIFGGSMAVYLEGTISAHEVHYNDINPFLVNLWWCMRDHRRKLIDSVATISLEKLNDRPKMKKYQKLHDKYVLEGININYPSLKKAVFMVYILTHCWSGNITKQGCGNPKSKAFKTWKKYYDMLSRDYYYNKIRNITSINDLDFNEVIDKFDDEKGCFYVDPPYMGKGKEYYTKDFPEKRHHELADRLKNCKSFWALSYYNYDNLEEMYPIKDFYWKQKQVTKTASAKNKSKEYEILIMPRKKLDNIAKQTFF